MGLVELVSERKGEREKKERNNNLEIYCMYVCIYIYIHIV